MTNVDVIKALKSLDLSKYPYHEVKELVSMFAPKILGVWIPKGQLIERIRPDAGVFERKEVSYRPAEYNTKPQRATLPVQAAGDYGMNVAIRPDVVNSKLMLTDVSEMEYVQENGKGNLRFTRHGIPVDMDERGLKRWRYAESCSANKWQYGQ